jgi:hypothetical protein
MNEFTDLIVKMRYDASKLEISNFKKLLIIRLFDFMLAILNDEKKNCNDLLDVIYTLYSEEN